MKLASLRLAAVLGAGLLPAFALAQDSGRSIEASAVETAREAPMTFAPSTDPERFVACVDNPMMPFIPGTVWHMREDGEDGTQEVTISVLKETREIAGIEATVVHDIVTLKGETVEDTMDWYAQDDRGNVWYLGEDTAEYEDGEVVSRAGSWEAGKDGARAGIVMLADPRPGDTYYQEYYRGEAEDMGAVEATDASAEVPYGSYDHALRTADYAPLEPSLERKWYATGIGVVKAAADDGSSTEELVDITHDAAQADPGRGCGETGGVDHVGK